MSDDKQSALEPNAAAIGYRLKTLRQKLGISQRELARRAGVPNGNLSLIEQGKVSPSISSLEKILRAVKVNLGEFFSSPAGAFDPIIREDEFVHIRHKECDWYIKHFENRLGLTTLVRILVPAGSETLLPIPIHGNLCVGLLLAGELDITCHGGRYRLLCGQAVELLTIVDLTLGNSGTEDARLALFIT